LSAAALGTTVVGPATADVPPPAPECVTATAHLATAKADFAAARKAFVATTKPLGKLLGAERTAARTEVRTSKVAIRQLQRQAAKSHDKAARATLLAQIRGERADIRHSTRLLESKAALRAQARADRKAAKSAFVAARSALKTARSAVDTACPDTTPCQPSA
jgi:hypothetical protein